MGRLNRRTAVITTARQGIGRATALAKARAGAKAISTGVDPAALESLAAIGLQTRVLNMRDPAASVAASSPDHRQHDRSPSRKDRLKHG